MNWCYVSNKKMLVFSTLLSFCSSSHAMMQKIKNLFAKQKKEELTLQQKFEHKVISNLEHHPQLAQKLKTYGKSIIICGAISGYTLGAVLHHALKPVSSIKASIALSLLLAAGQKVGVYDWSNLPLIKKVMNKIGTTLTEGAIIAISLPAIWLAYEHLPIGIAAVGALAGYYVHKS